MLFADVFVIANHPYWRGASPILVLAGLWLTYDRWTARLPAER